MHNKRLLYTVMTLGCLVGLFGGCGSEPQTADLAASNNTGVAQAAIVGGHPTGPNAFAPVGALVTTDRFGTVLSICTGTLIAPDVVLSAAHCMGPKKPAQPGWLMWFSTHDDATAFAHTNPTRVAQMMLHPDFDADAALEMPLAWRQARNEAESEILARLHTLCGAPANYVVEPQFWQCVAGLSPQMKQDLGLMDGAINMGDAALALLAEPLLDVSPLALLPTAATAPLSAGDPMHAVGYGIASSDRAQDQKGLRHVGRVGLDGVGQYELQVGFADSQLAFGDSGGPLFVEGDIALEIVGIASRSLVDAQGRCQGPTLYARTAALTPWIRQALREACRDGLRSVQMCKLHPF